jgi:hypothetical protein
MHDTYYSPLFDGVEHGHDVPPYGVIAAIVVVGISLTVLRHCLHVYRRCIRRPAIIQNV